MDPRPIDCPPRRFYADEQVIAGTELHPRRPEAFVYANHGRQVVRNRDGRWLCAFVTGRNLDTHNFLALAVSDTPDAVGGDMATVWLTGQEYYGLDALFHQTSLITGVCLLIDDADTLHVLYSDAGGLWRYRADASGANPADQLAKADAWTGPERLADAGDLLCDATWLPGGEIALYLTRDGDLFERVVGGAERRVCENARRPTVFVTPAGHRHVAFERDRRVFYIGSPDGVAWRDMNGSADPAMVAHFCSSWPSIAATPDGKVVIAYQGEGKADLRLDPERYVTLRGAGGCTVSYAVHDPAAPGWRIHDFLRSSEVLLSRRRGSNLIGSRGDFRHMMEEFWRPSLAVDKHGVLWMFYANSTRRHVFFTRFLGETFGDHFEAQGPYDCMSRILYLQKDCRGQSDIGFMTLASRRLYFDHVPTPDLVSDASRRVVFLDNMEVAELKGVEHRLGRWRKHPEPLFGKGITGDTRDDDVAWCEVRPVEGGYEMRYMGQGSLRSNAMPGRAFSADGLEWEKREPLDHLAMTLDGKPMPNTFWRPIYLEDPDETDPAKRYKGLQGDYFHEGCIEIRAWSVVTSPDTVHWTRVPGLPAIVLGDISCGFHLLRDEEDADPARRYKVSMLMASNPGRAVCVFTSPDLIHWSKVYRMRDDPEWAVSSTAPWPTGPIVIDPDGGESPWEEQVHDGVLWRENGLLMLHYDAFYFDGNQHISKALAVSRDGRHYYRVKRGALNMPHGNCGEWDSGRDRTCVPFRQGDDLWLYFCGMPAGCFSDPDAAPAGSADAEPPSPKTNEIFAELRPWRVGLAKLRVDGWGYLQRDREAESGLMTTIPFDHSGGTLVVNGSGLKPGAAHVEFLTPAGDVVPGFEARASAFSVEDDLDSRVTWSDRSAPPPGRYRLRFVIRDPEVKLYSFGFEGD